MPDLLVVPAQPRQGGMQSRGGGLGRWGTVLCGSILRGGPGGSRSPRQRRCGVTRLGTLKSWADGA